MLVLTELKRFKIFEKDKCIARVADLAVDLLKDEYPAATEIFFWNEEREFVALPWQDVVEIDSKRRRIYVSRGADAKSHSNEQLERRTLLVRDVLDALILDLQNRRVTRANDLWLEKKGTQLVLSHADFSNSAIFRRLSLGLWRRFSKRDLSDWQYVEFLKGDAALAVRRKANYHLRIAKLAPGEISQFIDLVPYLHAAELIALLPDELAADVLELTSTEKQLQIFEEFDEQQHLKMLELLAPETSAKIIKQLDENEAKRILDALPRQKSEQILELLRYPEGTVGSIMTNVFMFVPAELTVGEAREYITEHIKKTDFVYFIYVVKDEMLKRLVGALSLRQLFMANADEKISDVMDAYISFFSPLDDARTASFRLIDSHLAAMPAVDSGGYIVGVLTIDAAVSAVAPRSWRDQAPRVFS